MVQVFKKNCRISQLDLRLSFGQNDVQKASHPVPEMYYSKEKRRGHETGRHCIPYVMIVGDVDLLKPTVESSNTRKGGGEHFPWLFCIKILIC